MSANANPQKNTVGLLGMLLIWLSLVACAALGFDPAGGTAFDGAGYEIRPFRRLMIGTAFGAILFGVLLLIFLNTGVGGAATIICLIATIIFTALFFAALIADRIKHNGHSRRKIRGRQTNKN